jgi:hypothetical protein
MRAKGTFSTIIRNELCAIPFAARHCVLAEICALLDIRLQNKFAARRFNRLMQHAFGANGIDIRVKKAVEYSAAVVHSCCRRAYVRGCFIACGTCNDPGNSYHMEFALPQPFVIERLQRIFGAFYLTPKHTQRKNNSVLYFKESESIVNALIVMEAHKSVLEYENVRALKEMRNDVNRRVNFETANISKTVNAAIKQINDIQFIEKYAGLSCLPEPLENVAQLRLMYESASLQEIGAMLDPPVGKSGVNHRLRKISEIAESLRK